MDVKHDAALPDEPLLRYLDAVVRAHPRRASGLVGRVCFGVRFAGRTTWWVADFGAKGIETRITDRLPKDFDLGMAMDRQTALWAMGATESKGEMHISTGDQKLWDRFSAAFLNQADLISVRMGRGR